MFIDTHAHIHQHDPDEIAGIMSRAVAADVGAVITAGVTVEDSRKAIVLAHGHERIFAGVGMHPSDLAGPLTDADLTDLSDLAALPEVVVMSEIGIDHQERSPDRRWQEEAFQAQILVARHHGLPIVFHVREQGDDYDAHSAKDVAVAILRESGAVTPGGTAHYFHLEETARKVPVDRMLIETDAYPQPFKKNRAKWTEPRDIPLVAEKLALIRGVSANDIRRVTTENALNMLGNRSRVVKTAVRGTA